MTTADAHERLVRLLGGEARAGLRQRLRRRFELDRRDDTFTLTGLSTAERRALEDLLGRRARNASSIRLSLTELDSALVRAGVATSTRDALERLDGPIANRIARRAELQRCWQHVFDTCTDAKLVQLFATNEGRGLLKRIARQDPAAAERHLHEAQQVLARLPGRAIPLAQLAAEALHDAHGLDDGRPVATLVLAALRSRDDGRSRETWAHVGVLVNELSSPVLALNLAAHPDTPAGALVAAARERAEPLHLSLRTLQRRSPRWQMAGSDVFVCENPNIVAIAADRLGAECASLVCTDGMPAAAQRTLLQQLADAGARLRYHGDFDWPGIQIGNFIVRLFGATPWRFMADDYSPPAGRPLHGEPVEASWDVALTAKMRQLGRALDEEAIAETLLLDLRCP